MDRSEKSYAADVDLRSLAASVTAQAPPDFSGRWVLAPDPPAAPRARWSDAPGTMGTGWGADITVTQDAATLTIEYARFARSDMQPPTEARLPAEWLREPEHHQHGPRPAGAGFESRRGTGASW